MKPDSTSAIGIPASAITRCSSHSSLSILQLSCREVKTLFVFRFDMAFMSLVNRVKHAGDWEIDGLLRLSLITSLAEVIRDKLPQAQERNVKILAIFQALLEFLFVPGGSAFKFSAAVFL